MPPALAPRPVVAPTYAPLKAVSTGDAPTHCVVTGGNGLVGSRLVEMLAERGARSVLSLDLKLPADADVRALQKKFPGVVTFAVGDGTYVYVFPSSSSSSSSFLFYSYLLFC